MREHHKSRLQQAGREAERERGKGDGERKSFWKVEDWQQICKLPSVAFEKGRMKEMLGWETNSRQR